MSGALAAAWPKPKLEGTCATSGCKEQHRHPVTGATPDYHWMGRGVPEPRWYDPLKADPNDLWYTPTEVASVLGVHPKTVSRWIKSSGLPASRPGSRRIYIRARELTDWLKNQRRIAVVPAVTPK